MKGNENGYLGLCCKARRDMTKAWVLNKYDLNKWMRTESQAKDIKEKWMDWERRQKQKYHDHELL